MSTLSDAAAVPTFSWDSSWPCGWDTEEECPAEHDSAEAWPGALCLPDIKSAGGGDAPLRGGSCWDPWLQGLLAGLWGVGGG